MRNKPVSASRVEDEIDAILKEAVFKKASFELEAGSILIMAGLTQRFWKHQIPRTKKIREPRISIIFRTIKNKLK